VTIEKPWSVPYFSSKLYSRATRRTGYDARKGAADMLTI